MARENEHLQNLSSALDLAITERRKIAARLATDLKGAKGARDRFIRVQNTIDVIQRALGHEESIVKKKPLAWSQISSSSRISRAPRPRV